MDGGGLGARDTCVAYQERDATKDLTEAGDDIHHHGTGAIYAMCRDVGFPTKINGMEALKCR